jgi:hypothetical protein
MRRSAQNLTANGPNTEGPCHRVLDAGIPVTVISLVRNGPQSIVVCGIRYQLSLIPQLSELFAESLTL